MHTVMGGDFGGFCPDREWPDEELASHPDPAPTPQPTPAPSPAISAFDSQVKKLLEAHHLQVEVLKSIGIDPCLEYQQGQAAYHLAKVRKGDVKCPIYSRSCSNSQKLKNHIRARHQEVTAFRSAASLLVTHMLLRFIGRATEDQCWPNTDADYVRRGLTQLTT